VRRISLAHEYFHLGEIAHVVFEMAADEEPLSALRDRRVDEYSRFGERDELFKCRPRRSEMKEVE